MQIKWVLFLGGLGMVCQGCSPLDHAVRTLIIEPTQYPPRLDDLKECARNKKTAERAWAEFQEKQGEDFSEHFERGFKEGYADYLYAGGTGQPPPLPPRVYWRVEFETPEGQKAINDWFAGFSGGAALAAAGGHRELVTLPTSVKEPIGSVAPFQDEPLKQAPPPDEVLPPPKTVPPSEKQEQDD
jgi:hypothetical protein